LRQQTASPSLDHATFSTDTAALGRLHSTPALLRKTAALERLREHLGNLGVQEQLAIECAFLDAFAT
jgi:hypothetical protein